ncbi:MAG: hypothetical protein DMF84_27810 [Acidobacteria bacterium]|nr:MAG: hypothetical protein DMF84_27810 [Acidobacteriota bacterium]
MADKERMSPQASRESDPDDPEADRGDLTPPHGDELRAEGTFGRTDRYANQDDPDAEAPVLEHKALISEEELNADSQRRRMDQMDDAAAEEARMATRKREHSAE